MPRHPNRLQAMLTRHKVSVVVGEDVRYRIEQYRARFVERAEQEGHADLTNLTFEEALTDALDVGLEYDETLEGLVADVVDGHLFKRRPRKNRLIEDLETTGHCDLRGQSVTAVFELLARLDPQATVEISNGELHITG